MNEKSDKTIEGVEMVFSMGTTLGMVSEMSDGIMRIDLYRFSYNIEIWDIFYWFYVLFTTTINQNPDFDIIDPQLCFCIFLDFWFSDFRYGFPLCQMICKTMSNTMHTFLCWLDAIKLTKLHLFLISETTFLFTLICSRKGARILKIGKMISNTTIKKKFSKWGK